MLMMEIEDLGQRVGRTAQLGMIDDVRDALAVDPDFARAPQAGNPYALRKVGETEHGIVVRGARILATLAPFADEIAVYPALP